MKNLKHLPLIGLILIMVLTNSINVKAQLFPTKIAITVLDRLGNVVDGADVNLYNSEENYRNSSSPVFQGKTDKKGRVKFKKAKTISYFIDARKGEANNDGQGAKSDELQAKKVNKINIIIE